MKPHASALCARYYEIEGEALALTFGLARCLKVELVWVFRLKEHRLHSEECWQLCAVKKA